MKDAEKMTKLLEAAKAVLKQDIIPSLPSRKRLSALLVEEALSIALNTTYQLVRQEENETVKNNEIELSKLEEKKTIEDKIPELTVKQIKTSSNAVSYTHLTLPTKRIV